MANDWRGIAKAKDKKKAVQDYLGAILTEDKADKSVLEKVMKQFRKFSSEDDTMTLTFKCGREEYNGEDRTVTFSPPAEEPAGNLPASLSELAKIHAEISTECGGGGLISSACANSVSDFLIDDDQILGEVDPDEVIGVFDHGQNIVIGHPRKKNSKKEPVLYFIDHEDGQPQPMKEAKSLTARQVFLRLLATAIAGDEFFANVGE